MDNSNFSFGLGVERYLRSALPYGGLPSKDSPQMAFFDAASEGDLPRMRELASGRDAEGKAWLADVCIAGGGPFQTAARLGKLDAVRCMVEELGFDVNAGSQEGITALDAATMDERMDVMRYLLDHGADPNKRANSGFVPLHCAARKGRDEAAQLLLSSGASVDIAFSDGTPLHFAAACGTIGVMKVLLEHNADPNKLSEIGGTPLSETLCAADKGLPETILLKCVKLLVEAGADVNCTTQNPLVIATSHGLTNCVKYLLKAGADPNIPQCHCGVKPIELAASSGMRKLVELLFPLTSPIPTIPNWTVDGIMAHANSRPSKPKVKPVKNTKVQLKSYGEKAVQRKDYDGAAMFYTEAIELDPTDATLHSNRSLCHLEMTEAEKALQDANTCIRLRPEWIKGHFRKGAALMSLKDYTKACDAFMVGLQLDPGSAEMEKAFRGAVEAMKADHLARKGLKPSS
uniref:Uncharacterized protein n=1 Tax=Avena sativa TaxID=4498 RepID=A0ACD5W9N2_AVESA